MPSLPNLPPVPLDTVLLFGRAAFLLFSFVLAAVAFTRWRRVAERDTEHTLKLMTQLIERVAALEARIARSEPHLAALEEQLETHLNTATGGTPRQFGIAIRLARGGAGAEELIASCGLARQEAELVARLHGREAALGRPLKSDARHVALMGA